MRMHGCLSDGSKRSYFKVDQMKAGGCEFSRPSDDIVDTERPVAVLLSELWTRVSVLAQEGEVSQECPIVAELHFQVRH